MINHDEKKNKIVPTSNDPNDLLILQILKDFNEKININDEAYEKLFIQKLDNIDNNKTDEINKQINENRTEYENLKKNFFSARDKYYQNKNIFYTYPALQRLNDEKVINKNISSEKDNIEGNENLTRLDYINGYLTKLKTKFDELEKKPDDDIKNEFNELLSNSYDIDNEIKIKNLINLINNDNYEYLKKGYTNSIEEENKIDENNIDNDNLNHVKKSIQNNKNEIEKMIKSIHEKTQIQKFHKYSIFFDTITKIFDSYTDTDNKQKLITIFNAINREYNKFISQNFDIENLQHFTQSISEIGFKIKTFKTKANIQGGKPYGKTNKTHKKPKNKKHQKKNTQKSIKIEHKFNQTLHRIINSNQLNQNPHTRKSSKNVSITLHLLPLHRPSNSSMSGPARSGHRKFHPNPDPR